jgi:hypothetical protein
LQEKKNFNLQNPNICLKFPLYYNHTYKKKALQIFCVTKKCARDFFYKKWCSFTKIDGYQQQNKKEKKK